MPTHICCRDCRFEAVVFEKDAERTIDTHEEDEGHTVESESFDGSKRLVTDGGRDTLRLTDDGIEIPEDVDLSGGVVFRARGVTVDHKPGSQDLEFYPALEERHLDAEGVSVQNDHLSDDEVSIKPYGEEARTYEVTVPATDGGEDEDPDPEEMALEELREEYSERADIGFPEPEEHDRKMALWNELRHRVDVEQPPCPHCGEGNWGQAPGEPVQCNACGEYLGENPELREEIHLAWNAITHGDGDDRLEVPKRREWWDWPNTRGKILRHRDGNCAPVQMFPEDPGVVV